MHHRYTKPPIAAAWADESKLGKWQRVELAVAEARAKLGRVLPALFERLRDSLLPAPIDVELWKKLDRKFRHDLIAFLKERERFIPEELRHLWHKHMTSYDTEDPAFSLMILESLKYVWTAAAQLDQTIAGMAHKYRHTLMLGETHGQGADLQTFGAFCLSCLAELRVGLNRLRQAEEYVSFSKLSGAIGKYEAMDPELERQALASLGLRPFVGATQIVPRVVFLPTADALSALVGSCNNIALNLRLGCRSSERLWQEPFSPSQRGSSAMPHKRNPITLEQIAGMEIMAKHYAGMVRDTVVTWRERDISQSCVERNAWPDLFHVALHTLEQLNAVLSRLQIYPDQMLKQVVESRGCYAASVVKELLKEWLAPHGIPADDAYLVLQVAAFNLMAPDELGQRLREQPPQNLEEADRSLALASQAPIAKPGSIQLHIPLAMLRPVPILEVTQEQVDGWNRALLKVFSDPDKKATWDRHFLPSTLIKGQDELYRVLLGEEAQTADAAV